MPKYKGLNTFQRALKSNDKLTGCTVHFVNEKLDSGKIIIKKRVNINKDDNVEVVVYDRKNIKSDITKGRPSEVLSSFDQVSDA